VRRRMLGVALGVAMLLAPRGAVAYPLDAADETGILRLEGYRLAQDGTVDGPLVQTGGRRPLREIQLRLTDRPSFHIPPPDAELAEQIGELLGDDRDAYGIALLDISDPDQPRYAEINASTLFTPGSVGKVVVGLGMMQALADAYPGDVERRRAVLKNTQVTADAFIRNDSHDVPFWQPGDPAVEMRPLREGDTGNLNTFLDYMLSSSSNAAAAMVMRETMLLRHFGRDYPVSAERARAYFGGTSPGQLRADAERAFVAPVGRNGLDPAQLRQASFFTREGKRRVPSSGSWASPRELLHYLVAMEQGKLVDPFSSLELKRFLYLSERRIRYASSPEIALTRVYFKSGSLYKCRPERGFACEKYHGNVRNLMHSVAIVETYHRRAPLDYMVVVMSNVLRRNSTELHRELAARIHALIESRHPELPRPPPPPTTPPPAPRPRRPPMRSSKPGHQPPR
jgi:Beta-lactamase enzyme family